MPPFLKSHQIIVDRYMFTQAEDKITATSKTEGNVNNRRKTGDSDAHKARRRRRRRRRTRLRQFCKIDGGDSSL
ncbi:hypothetical protein ACTXT7_009605 [Hymenolepis weldensis]